MWKDRFVIAGNFYHIQLVGLFSAKTVLGLQCGLDFILVFLLVKVKHIIAFDLFQMQVSLQLVMRFKQLATPTNSICVDIFVRVSICLILKRIELCDNLKLA